MRCARPEVLTGCYLVRRYPLSRAIHRPFQEPLMPPEYLGRVPTERGVHRTRVAARGLSSRGRRPRKVGRGDLMRIPHSVPAQAGNKTCGPPALLLGRVWFVGGPGEAPVNSRSVLRREPANQIGSDGLVSISGQVLVHVPGLSRPLGWRARRRREVLGRAPRRPAWPLPDLSRGRWPRSPSRVPSSPAPLAARPVEVLQLVAQFGQALADGVRGLLRLGCGAL